MHYSPVVRLIVREDQYKPKNEIAMWNFGKRIANLMTCLFNELLI